MLADRFKAPYHKGKLGGDSYLGREDKALEKEISLLRQEEAKGPL